MWGLFSHHCHDFSPVCFLVLRLPSLPVSDDKRLLLRCKSSAMVHCFSASNSPEMPPVYSPNPRLGWLGSRQLVKEPRSVPWGLSILASATLSVLSVADMD
jgi:hypothetical protein